MCLILFAVDSHPRYRLVVAANRDEWFHRATSAAGFWADRPEVLAGRDLAQMGTWMGITRSGRFAAITNFREPDRRRTDAKSRGHLVIDFLAEQARPVAFMQSRNASLQDYNGFNMIAADAGEMYYLSNRAQSGAPAHQRIDPGVHGLSNHLLNTDWPKVRAGKAGLQAALTHEDVSTAALFDVLADRNPAIDGELPSTGVAPDRERSLSASHVLLGEYGTRSATVLLVDRDGGVRFSERSFDQTGAITHAVTEVFRLSPAPNQARAAS